MKCAICNKRIYKYNKLNYFLFGRKTFRNCMGKGTKNEENTHTDCWMERYHEITCPETYY